MRLMKKQEATVEQQHQQQQPNRKQLFLGTWTGGAGCVPVLMPDLTVRLRDIPLTKVAVTKSTRLNSRYMPARHLQLATKVFVPSSFAYACAIAQSTILKCQKFINKCLPNNKNNHNECDRCSALSNFASLHKKIWKLALNMRNSLGCSLRRLKL